MNIFINIILTNYQKILICFKFLSNKFNFYLKYNNYNIIPKLTIKIN